MAEYITKKSALSLVLTSVDLTEEQIQRLVDRLKEQEPANVAPAVRAKNVSDAHPSDEFSCGRCGLTLMNYCQYIYDEYEDDSMCCEYTTWNYCPRCGAIMEE